ncbi:hypothetical protein AAHH17_12585 [Lysinibacillus capsici]|uniref:hypothetical protein n=1 Tax=Lysinibacillus capsici TaxID=2115968 RepID=UPI0032E426EF
MPEIILPTATKQNDIQTKVTDIQTKTNTLVNTSIPSVKAKTDLIGTASPTTADKTTVMNYLKLLEDMLGISGINLGVDGFKYAGVYSRDGIGTTVAVTDPPLTGVSTSAVDNVVSLALDADYVYVVGKKANITDFHIQKLRKSDLLLIAESAPFPNGATSIKKILVDSNFVYIGFGRKVQKLNKSTLSLAGESVSLGTLTTDIVEGMDMDGMYLYVATTNHLYKLAKSTLGEVLKSNAGGNKGLKIDNLHVYLIRSTQIYRYKINDLSQVDWISITKNVNAIALDDSYIYAGTETYTYKINKETLQIVGTSASDAHTNVIAIAVDDKYVYTGKLSGTSNYQNLQKLYKDDLRVTSSFEDEAGGIKSIAVEGAYLYLGHPGYSSSRPGTRKLFNGHQIIGYEVV